MYRTSSYLPYLDGIRAISIIAVIMQHTIYMPNNTFNFGKFGVYTFFVLSGYLLSKNTYSTPVEFYKKRINRVFPLFYFYLFIALMIYQDVSTNFWTSLFFIENIHLSITGTFNFIYSHLWSLSTELQFYFVFPILLLLKNYKKLFFVLLIISGFLTHDVLDITSTFKQIFPAYTLFCFLIGMGFSILNTSKRAVLLICIPIFLFYSNEEIAYPLGATCLLTLNNNKTLTSNLLVYLGKRSYSIYLFHMLIINKLRIYLELDNTIWLFISTLICTMLVAELTARTIEKIKLFKLD